ncbi:glycosyltransferase family 9 protein [Xenorhabdus budapestensis]|uniref:glycosyltransferase family 9 protein n=1 Tax=Xenorhabdus budapestensis TaxID=290110 RepID=UPI001FCF0C6A|nr:glycosyltransferase family 9 protein [Xenorhabdus budapestensis]
MKNFVQVASDILKKDSTTQIVLIGSPNDISLQQEFMQLLPKIYHSRINQLVGKSTLIELTQKINELDLLVTGDTGPMHIAIALKIPTVSLFVTATCSATGPYQNPEIHKVILWTALSIHKHKHIMDCISPSVVIDEATHIMAH